MTYRMIYATKRLHLWVYPKTLPDLLKMFRAHRCPEKRWQCSMLVLVRFDSVLLLCVLIQFSCIPLGDYWTQKAHGSSDNKGKLLRRDGFALAEERYGTLGT